ncbi:MAG: DUF6883 domain-containing protein [Prochlorococcaceae cyanobacterium]
MLPHADHAIVDKAKICDYLLSVVHPVGRFKARVFISLGYTVENWTRLHDDLLTHGRTGTVLRIENNSYGMKVVISSTLVGSNGTSQPFKTTWLIPPFSVQPRLITEFPE